MRARVYYWAFGILSVVMLGATGLGISYQGKIRREIGKPKREFERCESRLEEIVISPLSDSGKLAEENKRVEVETSIDEAVEIDPLTDLFLRFDEEFDKLNFFEYRNEANDLELTFGGRGKASYKNYFNLSEENRELAYDFLEAHMRLNWIKARYIEEAVRTGQAVPGVDKWDASRKSIKNGSKVMELNVKGFKRFYSIDMSLLSCRLYFKKAEDIQIKFRALHDRGITVHWQAYLEPNL